MPAPYYGYRSKNLGVTMSPPDPQEQQPSRLHRISVAGHNMTVTVRHKLSMSTASAIIAYREEGRAAKATGTGLAYACTIIFLQNMGDNLKSKRNTHAKMTSSIILLI